MRNLIELELVNTTAAVANILITRKPSQEEIEKIIKRAERVSKEAGYHCGHTEAQGRVFADEGVTPATVAHALGHELVIDHRALQEFTTRTDDPTKFQIGLIGEEVPFKEETVLAAITRLNNLVAK